MCDKGTEVNTMDELEVCGACGLTDCANSNDECEEYGLAFSSVANSIESLPNSISSFSAGDRNEIIAMMKMTLLKLER